MTALLSYYLQALDTNYSIAFIYSASWFVMKDNNNSYLGLLKIKNFSVGNFRLTHGLFGTGISWRI